MSSYFPVNCQVCSPNMKNVDLFYKYEGLGKTYYISKGKFNTDVEAMDMCKTLCAYLAEIDDQAEGDLVIKMLESQDTTGMLIAGSDRSKEGDWKYDRTGRHVKYFNWCNGEPNNVKNEDCMGYKKGLSCMWDYSCYYRYKNFHLRYLCEV
ncbi:unnamed protein product [Lymnaea stagnalis]|uniref:C-type lectin domain-containing protein n=1 Tax=Lymnaea stagnalis TaxID=6523 RepID=A0AAV2HA02_LYMST